MDIEVAMHSGEYTKACLQCIKHILLFSLMSHMYFPSLYGPRKQRGEEKICMVTIGRFSSSMLECECDQSDLTLVQMSYDTKVL